MNPKFRRILLELVRMHPWDREWISARKLSRRFGWDWSTIILAFEYLEAEGYIRIIRRGTPKPFHIEVTEKGFELAGPQDTRRFGGQIADLI